MAGELTDRELAVLALVAEGHAIKEASTKLDISYEAARQRLRRAYEKLGANGGPDAVAKAMRRGLLL